ncbi:MAG: replication protein P [Endozoicomonas sp. (ex Botrylloides leachii)]|nr:replication protein P [Endozoicomonas sp. (ex Botrylloides leachii)]
MKKNTKTAFGSRKVDRIDAINALFAMLESAYPTKYKHAFSTDADRIQAMKVWTKNLQEFTPERILAAGKRAIDTVSFFPDLGDIRRLCKLCYQDIGLKEPLQAYYEACNAHPQSRDYPWSHLAVYLAARETGWLILQSEEQSKALPIFERNYSIICNRVLNGENLETSIPKGIEDGRNATLSEQAEASADQAQQILMKSQGIDPNNGKVALDQLREKLKT